MLRTRDELREHFAAAKALGLRLRRSADLVTYRGTDPEVLIGEFAYEGDSAAMPVRITNIFSMRVRDGLIVESRDYGDHLGIAGDTGQIPELAREALSLFEVLGQVELAVADALDERVPLRRREDEDHAVRLGRLPHRGVGDAVGVRR